jgi:hypothetical protein
MALIWLNAGDFGDEKGVGFVGVACDELALGDFIGRVLGKDFQDSYVFGFEDRTGTVDDVAGLVEQRMHI